MQLGVPKQTRAGETRAALVPAVVKRLVAGGMDLVVESGAGEAAHAADVDYEQAGAQIVAEGDDLALEVWESDVVVTIETPNARQINAMRAGSLLVGMLAPLQNLEWVKKLAEQKVTSLSMEFVPRISRAQSMDVLSSQANIGGYKAVLLAADRCPKMFPMMITAAGTLAPAKVFIIGAGVAGLQAIATATRLGAVVEAFDVRTATKEQVQSLGARFVELKVAAAEATGGYAGEQTEEERRQQQELMSRHVTGADAVVTTAAVFGKAPPLLIPADTVEQMSRGSVIVDLAASPEHGRGNCELTKPGEVYTTDHGVTIVGTTNLPALVPVHASQAYAGNMHALLREVIDFPKEGSPAFRFDLQDEIQKGAVITHEGQITNEMVRTAAEQTG